VTLIAVLCVAGPVAGGLIAFAAPRVARGSCIAGAAVAVGAAIRLLVGSLDGASTSQGFTVDPWRAGIALGLAAVATAVFIRDDLAGAAAVAVPASSGAAIGAILAVDAVTMLAFVALTTAGLGVAAWEAADRGLGRMFAILAVSDVSLVAGVLMVSGSGTRLPVEAAGVGGAFIAAASLVRVGLGTAAWLERDLDSTPARALLPAVAAHGIVMATWVARSGSDVATAVAVVAGALAALGARNAATNGSWRAALHAHAALVVVGVCVGSVAGWWGAVALVAGWLLAWIVRVLGAEATAAPSIGAAPLGASLVGTALVAHAVLSRGVFEHLFLLAAVPTGAAFLWLAHAGVASFRSGGRGSPTITEGMAVLPFLAIAVMVFLPEDALNQIGLRATPAAGAPPTLIDPTSVVSNELGLVFAVGALAAVAGWLLVHRRLPARAMVPSVHDGPRRSRAPAYSASVRASIVVGAVSTSVAVGTLLVLLQRSIQRGFL